jgi:hypothetical protein
MCNHKPNNCVFPSRLADVTDCVYVSSVSRAEECLSRSCWTFMPVSERPKNR